MKKINLLFSVMFIFFSFQVYSNETDIVNLINEYRLSNGLNILTLADPSLQITALEYSRELAERGQLTHIDSNGESSWNRAYRNGHTALRVGEILGYQLIDDNAGNMLLLWKESPTHNAVMLNPDWNSITFSKSFYGNKVIYVCLFSTSVISSYSIVNDKLSVYFRIDETIYWKQLTTNIVPYSDHISLLTKYSLIELFLLRDGNYIMTDRLTVRKQH